MRHLTLIKQICATVVTIVLIIIMFPHKSHGTHYDYALGAFWKSNDLYAPFDFQVVKDAEQKANDLALAKSKCVLFYQPDSNAHTTAIQRLMKLRLPSSQHNALRKSIDSIYKIGYIELADEYPDVQNHTIVILTGNSGTEHKPSEFVLPTSLSDALLIDSILAPSLRFDNTRTQLELDSRLSQLSYTSQVITTGQLIVAKGELVTPEKVAMLSSLEAENDKRFIEQYNPYAHYIGRFMLCAIAFAALFMFLKVTHHRILDSTTNIIIVLTTILLMTLSMSLVMQVRSTWFLVVPLCIGPILIHAIYDMRAALYVHLTTIIILGHMVPDSFEFIFYQLIAGMMSIITVKDFERRSQFFVVSLVIFVTYATIYTCGILWQDTNLHNLRPDRYLIFFINAILTLLAHPLIYLFERSFHITTNLSLMEIANTNTPALRELSRRAPGTFQHSMQVANLSEDIISEIGGNALLAKVGAMYHDIGKINAPIYFTENQNSGYNPHTELSCEESARIITQHVIDGIALAHQYKLPSEIIDFIRCHHGTTYTGYFYTKYKNEHPNEEINESVFRYPGPTPYSRETAVVMIVDSVEAACKSLHEHDKEHIDKIVDSIVFGKIEAGQMSSCTLTFNDISNIRRMLKSRMLSIYHARIAYPVASDKSK
ncbi:MAG: HDIG domain-containing protein [Bacteroidales bacterium]|nr:HDIG domain-containing protein [Candidatus Colimorpha onthohippi]